MRTGISPKYSISICGRPKYRSSSYQSNGDLISYRWGNCVKGFNMPVKVFVGGQAEKWITPTDDWQTMRAGTDGQSAGNRRPRFPTGKHRTTNRRPSQPERIGSGYPDRRRDGQWHRRRRKFLGGQEFLYRRPQTGINRLPRNLAAAVFSEPVRDCLPLPGGQLRTGCSRGSIDRNPSGADVMSFIITVAQDR